MEGISTGRMGERLGMHWSCKNYVKKWGYASLVPKRFEHLRYIHAFAQ